MSVGLVWLIVKYGILMGKVLGSKTKNDPTYFILGIVNVAHSWGPEKPLKLPPESDGSYWTIALEAHDVA
jgi:hypothetical protein